jgi:hypothetical protein
MEGFRPIAGCSFGLEVVDPNLSPQTYANTLHEHGLLLFRMPPPAAAAAAAATAGDAGPGQGRVSAPASEAELVRFLRARFPEAAPRPKAEPVPSSAARSDGCTTSARAQAADVLAYLDKRLVTSMGSVKDVNGGFAIDYVPASESGASLLAVSVCVPAQPCPRAVGCHAPVITRPGHSSVTDLRSE